MPLDRDKGPTSNPRKKPGDSHASQVGHPNQEWGARESRGEDRQIQQGGPQRPVDFKAALDAFDPQLKAIVDKKILALGVRLEVPNNVTYDMAVKMHDALVPVSLHYQFKEGLPDDSPEVRLVETYCAMWVRQIRRLRTKPPVDITTDDSSQ